VRVALLGRERHEDRFEPLHRLIVPSDHQAEADLEPPDPSRHAGVDEVDSLVLCLDVASLRVAEVRVAAVDDRVALVRDLEQLVEDVLGDLSGRNHQPEGARRLELLLELTERRGGPLLDVRVVGADVVAVLAQTLRHAVAHATEADHSELHQVLLPLGGSMRGRGALGGRSTRVPPGGRERSRGRAP